MILAFLPVAAAAPRFTVVDAPLTPGRATVLEVADDMSTGPAARPPEVVVRGASVRPFVAVRPGVFHATLVPAISAEAVEITLAGQTARFELVAPPAARLRVPEQVEAQLTGDPVAFVVEGFTGAPSDLEVATSEGVVTTSATEGGVRVTVAPDPLVHPRWILLAVRDRRETAAPSIVRVRVRGRPRIPLQVEPGVQLDLVVGGRAYGPFLAADNGAIEGRVDQYPGEHTATAVLTDALGNVTRTEIPLVSETEATLVATATEDQLPGRPPPVFHVVALTPVGAPSPVAPVCRAPFGELPLRSARPGAWFGALPPLGASQDVRVICTLGGRQATFRVPVAAGVPARVSLRVWPEELRTDFPDAEVRVALEDARGERLPVEHVVVEADVGVVTLRPADGILRVGDYDGAAAAAAGRDRVRARYDAPPGAGPVRELELGWSAPSPDGFSVHARALDAGRRPLAGVAVRLSAGERDIEAVTGPDGWATADLRPDWSGAPLLVAASADGWTHRGLVLPTEGASGGPGTGDLTASVALALRPGRVAGLDVDVDPPLLRAGPGAVAWVIVRMEDGLGQPVTDEPVTVVASEGVVGELHERSDGSLIAEYVPSATESAREVEITASTPSMHSSARLTLEPRVVRYSLGPWVGLTTNFGPRVRPIGGIDLDVRVRNRLVGEALVARLGVSATGFVTPVVTGVGPNAELRSTLVPGTVALLLRDDRGPWSLWGGAGIATGVHHLEVRFGAERVTSGETWVVGPEFDAAVVRRAFGGEAVLGLRGTWLTAPDEDVGYTGNLGGLSGTLGYRLVW